MDWFSGVDDSWVEPPGRGTGRTAALEEIFEVEGRVRGSVFETESDLGVAEAAVGGEAVNGGTTIAKSFFDGAAKGETHAVQIARDAGLVFAELLADFGEGLPFGVIEAQTLLIARIESGKRGLQSSEEKSYVTLAVRVGRLNGNWSGEMIGSGFCTIAIVERFEAPSSADGVNVAASENGAEPCFQGAAAVEIAEERAFAAVALREAIKFGKKRIGKLERFRGRGAATENCGGGGTEIAAIGGEEKFPGGFTIFQASGGQCQIFEMQSGEIFVEFFRRKSCAGEAFLGATLK